MVLSAATLWSTLAKARELQQKAPFVTMATVTGSQNPVVVVPGLAAVPGVAASTPGGGIFPLGTQSLRPTPTCLAALSTAAHVSPAATPQVVISANWTSGPMQPIGAAVAVPTVVLPLEAASISALVLPPPLPMLLSAAAVTAAAANNLKGATALAVTELTVCWTAPNVTVLLSGLPTAGTFPLTEQALTPVTVLQPSPTSGQVADAAPLAAQLAPLAAKGKF